MSLTPYTSEMEECLKDKINNNRGLIGAKEFFQQHPI